MSTKPLAILDEHPHWLEPLYTALEQRSIPYLKVNISSAGYSLDDTDLLPLYVNRMSPSAFTRDHAAVFNYTYNYLSHLEQKGAKVINGSHTVLLETSKALQASLLQRLGIPHPKTVVVNNTQQLLQYLDRVQFPVVVKPNCGGSGSGISKYYSKQELSIAVQENNIILPDEKVLLLQEFIQPKNDHIVRVETLNGKVLYAMKVFTQGTFNLCPSDGCDVLRNTDTNLGYCSASSTDDVRFELYRDIPKNTVTAIEKLVAEANLDLAGIEYVVDKDDNWYVYDINALSILRSSFKDEYGIDAWGLVADYLVSEYEAAVSYTR